MGREGLRWPADVSVDSRPTLRLTLFYVSFPAAGLWPPGGAEQGGGQGQAGACSVVMMHIHGCVYHTWSTHHTSIRSFVKLSGSSFRTQFQHTPTPPHTHLLTCTSLHTHISTSGGGPLLPAPGEGRAGRPLLCGEGPVADVHGLRHQVRCVALLLNRDPVCGLDWIGLEPRCETVEMGLRTAVRVDSWLSFSVRDHPTSKTHTAGRIC